MASGCSVVALRRTAGYKRLATAGQSLIAIFVVCALFAPWIAPYDPAHIELPIALMPPSAAHWFGTDELGRDILSRIIYGGAYLYAGGRMRGGGVADFGADLWLHRRILRRLTDRLLNVVVMNAFMSFPGILLAIAFVAFPGQGFST